VSFGLDFSQDTYKGFGVGSSMSLGKKIEVKGLASLNAGVTYGVDPYGGAYISAGVGASIGIPNTALKLGANAGVFTNFESVSMQGGAGLTAYGNKLLGSSISSCGGGASLTVGGITASVHNDNAGRIQTESSGFNLDIPVLPILSVSLGYSYVRYWSDEMTHVQTNGVLYYPTAPNLTATQLDAKAFDTYSLYDLRVGMTENLDADNVMGGSFPDCDNYNVTAQGLSGSIRPYVFNQTLYRQNKKENTGSIPIPGFGRNDIIKNYYWNNLR